MPTVEDDAGCLEVWTGDIGAGWPHQISDEHAGREHKRYSKSAPSPKTQTF